MFCRVNKEGRRRGRQLTVRAHVIMQHTAIGFSTLQTSLTPQDVHSHAHNQTRCKYDIATVLTQPK